MRAKFHMAAMLACAVMFAAGPSHAQDVGSATHGLDFAKRVCASCHAVEPGGKSPVAEAPPFETIAAAPGLTAMALQASLQSSHRSMPNLILAPNDRSDVIAYILSLKKS